MLFLGRANFAEIILWRDFWNLPNSYRSVFELFYVLPFTNFAKNLRHRCSAGSYLIRLWVILKSNSNGLPHSCKNVWCIYKLKILVLEQTHSVVSFIPRFIKKIHLKRKFYFWSKYLDFKTFSSSAFVRNVDVTFKWNRWCTRYQSLYWYFGKI